MQHRREHRGEHSYPMMALPTVGARLPPISSVPATRRRSSPHMIFHSFTHSFISHNHTFKTHSFIHSAPPARWPRCAPRGRAGPPTPPAHPPSPAPAGTGSHPCRAPVGTAGTAGDSGSQGTGPANSASRMGSCKCHMGTCLPGSAASHLCMQQSQTNGPARHTTARQCSTQNALLTGSTWLFQEVTSVTLFHSSYCQTRVRLRRPGGRECSKVEDPGGGQRTGWACRAPGGVGAHRPATC